MSNITRIPLLDDDPQQAIVLDGSGGIYHVISPSEVQEIDRERALEVLTYSKAPVYTWSAPEKIAPYIAVLYGRRDWGHGLFQTAQYYVYANPGPTSRVARMQPEPPQVPGVSEDEADDVVVRDPMLLDPRYPSPWGTREGFDWERPPESLLNSGRSLLDEVTGSTYFGEIRLSVDAEYPDFFDGRTAIVKDGKLTLKPKDSEAP
jgi:hypothetical protein